MLLGRMLAAAIIRLRIIGRGGWLPAVIGSMRLSCRRCDAVRWPAPCLFMRGQSYEAACRITAQPRDVAK